MCAFTANLRGEVILQNQTCETTRERIAALGGELSTQREQKKAL